MKSIVSFISESILSKQKGIYNDRFPTPPSRESVVKFLKNHGFREVDYGKFYKSNGRVYALGKFTSDYDYDKWVRFVDNSGSGTVYFCRLENLGMPGCKDFGIEKKHSEEKTPSWDEFVEEVEREFC